MALSTTLAGTSFSIGDTVSVHYRIIEKEIVAGKTKKEKHEEQKERTQAFTGIVIAIRGTGDNQSFTVRHLGVGNIGVERIFPVISPWIKKIVVEKKGKVRRAKLYYLREKSRKEISRLAGRVDKVLSTASFTETSPPLTKVTATVDSNSPHAEQPA